MVSVNIHMKSYELDSAKKKMELELAIERALQEITCLACS